MKGSSWRAPDPQIFPRCTRGLLHSRYLLCMGLHSTEFGDMDTTWEKHICGGCLKRCKSMQILHLERALKKIPGLPQSACVWISTSNMHIHSSIENVTTTILGWRTIRPTSTETRDLPLYFCILVTHRLEDIEKSRPINNPSKTSQALQRQYIHIQVWRLLIIYRRKFRFIWTKIDYIIYKDDIEEIDHHIYNILQWIRFDAFGGAMPGLFHHHTLTVLSVQNLAQTSHGPGFFKSWASASIWFILFTSHGTTCASTNKAIQACIGMRIVWQSSILSIHPRQVRQAHQETAKGWSWSNLSCRQGFLWPIVFWIAHWQVGTHLDKISRS